MHHPPFNRPAACLVALGAAAGSCFLRPCRYSVAAACPVAQLTAARDTTPRALKGDHRPNHFTSEWDIASLRQ